MTLGERLKEARLYCDLRQPEVAEKLGVNRYKDWQGKSHVTTKRGFRTQREAKAYEASMQSKASPASTLSDVLTAFLNDRKPNIKHSSYLAARRAVEKYIRPQLGHIKLTDLTPKLLRDWELSLQAYESPLTGKPISPAYLHSLCVWLSTILNYAVKFYGLPSNPMKVIGLLGKSQASQKFWSLDEYSKFAAVLPDNDMRLFFDVIFFSGMRIGEFLALAPSDIDYTQGTITINKSVMLSTGQTVEPKNRYSIRTISMPRTIMNSIHAYADRYYDTPERLFPIDHQRLERAIKKYAAIAGVPAIKVHDLRHSHASLLIHQGTPITAISRRLGHSSPATTLRIYSHMYADAQSEIANMLDNFVFKT